MKRLLTVAVLVMAGCVPKRAVVVPESPIARMGGGLAKGPCECEALKGNYERLKEKYQALSGLFSEGIRRQMEAEAETKAGRGK